MALPLRAEYLTTPIRAAMFGLVAIRLRFIDAMAGDPSQQSQDLHFALSIVARPVPTAAPQWSPE